LPFLFSSPARVKFLTFPPYEGGPRSLLVRHLPLAQEPSFSLGKGTPLLTRLRTSSQRVGVFLKGSSYFLSSQGRKEQAVSFPSGGNDSPFYIPPPPFFSFLLKFQNLSLEGRDFLPWRQSGPLVRLFFLLFPPSGGRKARPFLLPLLDKQDFFPSPRKLALPFEVDGAPPPLFCQVYFFLPL